MKNDSSAATFTFTGAPSPEAGLVRRVRHLEDQLPPLQEELVAQGEELADLDDQLLGNQMALSAFKSDMRVAGAKLTNVLSTAERERATLRRQLGVVVDSVCQLQHQQLSTAHQPQLVASLVADFASYKGASEAAMAALQEANAQQAAMLTALKARMEEAERSRAEEEAQRKARKACQEATLRQLQVVAARQQVRRQSRAWGLRTLLVPLSAAAGAAAAVAAVRLLSS